MTRNRIYFFCLVIGVFLLISVATIFLLTHHIAESVVLVSEKFTVTDRYVGATIVPKLTGDFSSDFFKQSLRNLHATGANSVSLLIDYYQKDTKSTEIFPGKDTPSTIDLINATKYAHSLGMSVAFDFHVETQSHDWRAYINPADRDAWFSSYGGVLRNLAVIGQANSVELIVIGTELVNMSTNKANPTNTQHWLNLISSIRRLYDGKLIYEANASSDRSDDMYGNEKKFIDFWSQLDYIGLSAYVFIGNDSKYTWSSWRDREFQPISIKYNKPIIFAEIGYRSIQSANKSPYDSSVNRPFDQESQAAMYKSFLSFWGDQSYLKGVFFWNWSSYPKAGGLGDKNYTPQNKEAEQVMKNYLTP